MAGRAAWGLSLRDGREILALEADLMPLLSFGAFCAGSSLASSDFRLRVEEVLPLLVVGVAEVGVPIARLRGEAALVGNGAGGWTRCPVTEDSSEENCVHRC